MALRDEIQDLIRLEVGATEAGQLFLSEGEEALRDARLGVEAMLEITKSVFAAHRAALLRLADAIDELDPH